MFRAYWGQSPHTRPATPPFLPANDGRCEPSSPLTPHRGRCPLVAVMACEQATRDLTSFSNWVGFRVLKCRMFSVFDNTDIEPLSSSPQLIAGGGKLSDVAWSARLRADPDNTLATCFLLAKILVRNNPILAKTKKIASLSLNNIRAGIRGKQPYSL